MMAAPVSAIFFAGCGSGCLVGAVLSAVWRRRTPTNPQDRSRRSLRVRLPALPLPKSNLDGESQQLAVDLDGGGAANIGDLHRLPSDPCMRATRLYREPSLTPVRPNLTGSPRGLNRTIRRQASAQFTKNELSVVEEKLVIVMVGLPARGKSFISNALLRYLNLLGCAARMFNAGSSRRSKGRAGATADFFDTSNAAAKQLREELAMQCLDSCIDFLKGCSMCAAVGILDATNTTIERRCKVSRRVAEEGGIGLMFVESICNDEALLQVNYKLKLANADYEGMEAATAMEDFLQRVRRYEQVYEPLQDEEEGEDRSYIKIVDAGVKLIKHRCTLDAKKQVPSHILTLLHSIHLGPRSIYFVVVGPTTNDVQGFLGGDSPLTARGEERMNKVAAYMSQREDDEPALVMSGTLQRHLQSAHLLKVAGTSSCPKERTVLQLQRLNDLCLGSFDNMSAAEIQEYYPHEAAARARDKFNYRYPGEGGESYSDLVARMREHILRLEQLHGSALVLCDKRVCRVFLAYFRGTRLEEIPYIDVLWGVVQFDRSHHGFDEIVIDI
mmetsp:Transcript_26227/g.75682  ORF Transcript_26227/g.75682 Transcript_26227/m.75682 type:complete len:556 (-) Transcript_26227:61-1728(-)